jgi:hypothetical protein
VFLYAVGLKALEQAVDQEGERNLVGSEFYLVEVAGTWEGAAEEPAGRGDG